MFFRILNPVRLFLIDDHTYTPASGAQISWFFNYYDSPCGWVSISFNFSDRCQHYLLIRNFKTLRWTFDRSNKDISLVWCKSMITSDVRSRFVEPQRPFWFPASYSTTSHVRHRCFQHCCWSHHAALRRSLPYSFPSPLESEMKEITNAPFICEWRISYCSNHLVGH